MSEVLSSLRGMRRLRAGSLDVVVPETVSERMRGLRGANLERDQALLIERCRSIHTFGMRHSILVAWLDGEHRVSKVQRVRPRRLATNLRARHVLECRADADIRVGDVMKPSLVRS